MSQARETNSDLNSQGRAEASPLPAGLLADHPWLTFLLPFLVFMLVGSHEPTPGEGGARGPWFGFYIEYQHYPIVYSVKIFLTLLAMLYVLPGYRTFRFRISPLAVVVGVVGVVVWIALCHMQIEAKVLGPIEAKVRELLGFDAAAKLGAAELGERSAFNPLEQLAHNRTWAYSFLAIRFFGLALVVPIIEEFFLRGFLLRFVVSTNWWQIPIGKVNRTAVIAGTAVPMLMHPGELLAALVWFSAVTWLMVRTRNIWDCVAAHAVTNLLLGIYVVMSGHWELM